MSYALAVHIPIVGMALLPVLLGGPLLLLPAHIMFLQMIIDRAGSFAKMGLVAAGMNIEGRTCAEYCDNAERFGVDVIAKLHGAI